jgi:EmrB/QacA subfamily drug resistance transporter
MNAPDSAALAGPPHQTHVPLPERKVTRREFLEIFTAVMLPMFMAMIDQTLLATATPVVAADFHNLFETAWIGTAYMLTSAVMIPVYGRLGDRYGRRRMLVTALAVFVGGSLLCGASQSMHQLIAGRALQGLGAGGLMSLAFALIGEMVPPRQRASYQGYFAMNSMAANMLGPIIGGQVVAHASWRWLFFVNLPLGLLAAWRLMRLPKSQAYADAPGVSDVPGLLLFAAATAVLLFGLSSAGHRFAWLSWPTALLVGGGVLGWIVLLLLEQRLLRRQGAPFFPIDLLRTRSTRLLLATAVLSTFCLLALVFYLPVYLQLGLHTGAARSGMLLTPVLLGFILGGTLSGRRLGRTGDPKPIPIIGLSLSCAAFIALALAPPHLGLLAVLGFLAGLGLGPTMPVVQVTVQSIAGRESLGAATSLTTLSRTMGAALGTALTGAVIYGLMPDIDLDQVTSLRASGADLTEAVARNTEVLHAFHTAFFCSACVAGIGLFIASRLPRLKI